jgi:hypothetical protein
VQVNNCNTWECIDEEECNGGSGTSCPNEEDFALCQSFAGVWYEALCWCDYASPVIIDVTGDGFDLTNLANGVDFEFILDGVPEHVAWTARNSDDAFLVLHP